jgi:YfiH family protein
MIRSSLLSEIDWLDHGFGTRTEPLSQDGMASLKQIHSAKVLAADAAGLAGEGDALVTDRAGVTLSVRTADCYPILLADVARRVVAAVHAGWRGTNAEIVGEALRQMKSDPRDVRAAIGPGIGGCCYFVGEEVARLFGRSEAGKIDLAEVNREQLIKAGVPAANIEVMGQCTFCDAGQFHSYRRDKEQAGRMISYIGIRANRGARRQESEWPGRGSRSS